MLRFALGERILELRTLAPRFGCALCPLVGLALGLCEVGLPAPLRALLTLTLCPSVLVLPARPSLLRLQECALLDFGLRARNHRFPVVAMLLRFPELASLRLALGPLVLDAPRPAFLGLAPEPLVFGLPPRLALGRLPRQTLRGLLLCLLVRGLSTCPPFLGLASQAVVFGL